MLRLFRALIAAVLVPLTLTLAIPSSAFADDVTVLPDGTVVPSTSSSTSTTAATAGDLTKAGEIAKGNQNATTAITGIFSSVITSAVTVATLIKPQADKFASGLAVITVVLAFVRYAATRDPIMAWVVVFEELGILGIFAALYVGFASWAPGFYQWFLGMANTISGSDMTSALSIMGSAAGQLFDGFMAALKTASWTQYIAVAFAIGPLVMAWAVLSVTSIVFIFYTNLGQLQMAVGTVMGQIAFALGFSSFTRGYFKTWLDFMISAGMYTVVAAILMRLVTQSLVSAIQAAVTKGLSTPGAASYVLDMALFAFLVSFEIPKMAGMFGGGAGVSGSIVSKISKAATGGIV
ncbi:TrbL/VirB6 plasmid conjugal transfer protein [Paraburkholderia fungorum]|uniref:TrbL/VirB6 plasmid conjugal transfer protein n=1 Tax=Paraburkholderia fungorum TaxID=134537 RepID=A0A1H1JY24_9BURK|nr:type IV secretion system protein [Paraburkholderia fungorum]SDR54874.1 TrbL/VirB6 plasmid conjugal transfer protein [Paraburkholderia fungorum]